MILFFPCYGPKFLYMSCHAATVFAIIITEGAVFMARTVNRYISELLQAYQEITQKTCTEMALDFDVTLSNLYLYRNGVGNPRATTIDKIVIGVRRHCPEAFDRISRW